MSWGEKEGQVYHIVSKYRKLEQKKYKSIQLGKLINWKLCKKLYLDDTAEW